MDKTSLLGYFDSPGQSEPTFDPGLQVPCPVCIKPLHVDDIKTISLMKVGEDKTYFYRMHRICYDGLEPSEREIYDQAMRP